MNTRLFVPVADCLILSIMWQISLAAVSEPRESEVPGKLLLIVAGITTIGMRKAGYFSRAFARMLSE
jgi:hypothetical protein